MKFISIKFVLTSLLYTYLASLSEVYQIFCNFHLNPLLHLKNDITKKAQLISFIVKQRSPTILKFKKNLVELTQKNFLPEVWKSCSNFL